MLQNREQRSQLILGVLIIALGVLSLISRVIAGDAAAWMWIIALVVATGIFAWAYTFEKEAWAVLGAYITGAVAILIFVVTKAAIPELWIPVIVLLGVALPFFVAWLADRTKWGLLIVAYILVAVVVMWLFSEGMTKQEQLVPAYVMLVIGLPFIVGYLVTRNARLLIPGGILWAIALAFLGTSVGLSEEAINLIAPLVAIAIGVYILYRTWSHRAPEHKPK